jgi:catechol 2,3 dioxygenase
MTAPPDLAHIHHAELLTPCLDDSLRFFTELFGLQVEHAEGDSVYLRGWGEYQRYGLVLTASKLPGLGHVAMRAWSQEALERRVQAIEAAGLGDGWIDADHGHGPAYRFHDPDGHRFELLYEADRYAPPERLRPRLRNVPQRYVGTGACAKRLDHVNVLAADVAANRAFAMQQLGFRLYEQVVLDDGTEAGAWMSLTIAAHELIYTADHAGGSGRLHHLAWFVDTREEILRAADLLLDADVPIEAAPSKHAVAQGMFLYVYEPGGNRVELTTGTHFIYDPAYEPVVWTEAERARGQAWGVKTIETFHTYGTPDISGEATGPPLPPTSRIPAR